jgi:hypothetical protein
MTLPAYEDSLHVLNILLDSNDNEHILFALNALKDIVKNDTKDEYERKNALETLIKFSSTHDLKKLNKFILDALNYTYDDIKTKEYDSIFSDEALNVACKLYELGEKDKAKELLESIADYTKDAQKKLRKWFPDSKVLPENEETFEEIYINDLVNDLVKEDGVIRAKYILDRLNFEEYIKIFHKLYRAEYAAAVEKEKQEQQEQRKKHLAEYAEKTSHNKVEAELKKLYDDGLQKLEEKYKWKAQLIFKQICQEKHNLIGNDLSAKILFNAAALLRNHADYPWHYDTFKYIKNNPDGSGHYSQKEFNYNKIYFETFEYIRDNEHFDKKWQDLAKKALATIDDIDLIK